MRSRMLRSTKRTGLLYIDWKTASLASVWVEQHWDILKAQYLLNTYRILQKQTDQCSIAILKHILRHTTCLISRLGVSTSGKGKKKTGADGCATSK